LTEWLLDNEYLLRKALREVREGLPGAFYRDLPKLEEGPRRGEARVLDLAEQLLTHAVFRLQVGHLASVLNVYQTIRPLDIGELWALPAALRLACLHELAKVAAATVGLGMVESGNHPSAALEARRPSEAANRVPDCIECLRLLDELDWEDFFERVSLVERTLRRDPTGHYERMDFQSRDRYRKAIEDIARWAGAREVDVAAEALVRSKRELRHGSPEAFQKRAHVGFHLVDAGREDLEKSVGAKPNFRERLDRWLLWHARGCYFGGIGALSALGLVALLAWVSSEGVSLWLVALFAVLGLIPAVTVGVAAVNWLVVHVVPPRVLPKLQFREGIPAEHRTVVVIPCLLSDSREVRALLRRLESHYHASVYGGALTFALLSDFEDSHEHVSDGDALLLEDARSGVQALNRKFGDRESGPFLLLHRERRWNPAEGRWMGWERKRGKLWEFNRLVLTGDAGGFTTVVGDVSQLREARFVITLDADTRMPSGTVERLASTLAHPLNLPEWRDDGTVAAGYTVLQPRLQTAPLGASRTPFQKILEGEVGLDLYSRAVSDVYQDLFGEGVYVGKGIYHVAAFESSLRGRIPDNALLSHDLFEGICGRVALVSDVHLLEDYPSHLPAYLRRLHRWIRGDWQLLPWLLPRVPSASGTRVANPFDLLGRWKIVDNLRRSLVPPALLSLTLAGWLLGPHESWKWTALAALVLAVPVLLGGAAFAARRLRRVGRLRQRDARPTWSSRFYSVVRTAGDEGSRWLLQLIFIPATAVTACDAIGRTLVRLLVTRRRLLQWTTVSLTARAFHHRVAAGAVWKAMVSAPLVAVGVTALAWLRQPAMLVAVLPLTLPWLLSPQLAHLLSRPTAARRERLAAKDKRFLRRLALRTWLFFERFVDSEHHWLPPDNYREGEERVAARTSPTNVGLMLTSVLAAYDLGYMGPLAVEAMVRNTFETLERIERYRGHFLNWYSTRDLESLHPKYVSTVDSGNLAAGLIVLASGLRELSRRPLLRRVEVDAALDVLEVLDEAMEGLEDEAGIKSVGDARALLRDVRTRVSEVTWDPVAFARLSAELHEDLLPALDEHLLAILEEPSDSAPEGLYEVKIWWRKANQHVAQLRRDIETLLPWLLLVSGAPSVCTEASRTSSIGQAWHGLDDQLRRIPTLTNLPDWAARAEGALERLSAAVRETRTTEEELDRARGWSEQLRAMLGDVSDRGERLRVGLEDLAVTAARLVDEMDFKFLHDPHRKIFHLGFDVTTDELDPHHYDLLASEARLGSFVAMGKGDAPVSHWLHLGRPFGTVRARSIVLSWGGTVFEYLLPAHFLITPEDSLMMRICRSAVREHSRYGRQHDVPWGLSESGYLQTEFHDDYGYRAFGVPSLALKRDPDDRLVVAPYASVLALPFDPKRVVRNLERLCRLGMLGTYGFYEALDFGPRSNREQRGVPVRSFMAHHQGMILLALDNCLEDQVMVDRFHAAPGVEAIEYLLFEGAPRLAPRGRPWAEEERRMVEPAPLPPVERWEVPEEAMPQVQLLSNGKYQLLISSTGAGASSWQGFGLTRSEPDAALEDCGAWIYLQDLDADATWSVTRQPTGLEADASSCFFAPHVVEYHRRRDDVAVETRICVAADDDVEIRLLKVTNRSARSRRLAVTSYGEIAMASPEDYRRHPTYEKLFVEAEFLPEKDLLLFRRRPRSSDEPSTWLAHALVGGDRNLRVSECTVSRERFLGRNGCPATPLFLQPSTERSVRGARPSASSASLPEAGAPCAPLDPVFALRTEFELHAFRGLELAFLNVVGTDRESVVEAVELYGLGRAHSALERVSHRSARLLRQHGLDSADARTLQRLLSALVHPRAMLRAQPQVIARNRCSQRDLWRYGLSGDFRILLGHVATRDEISLPFWLLRAHAYLHELGYRFDLVLLDLEPAGYEQPLRDRLEAAVERDGHSSWLGARGGVHLLQGSAMTPSDVDLLEAAAHAVLDSQTDLAAQLARGEQDPDRLPAFVPAPSGPRTHERTPPLDASTELEFDNGIGGFAADGTEYVIRRGPDRPTPAPWINVVANPSFGFLVSEAALGSTWSVHSSENRLTPWRNDPLLDDPSEVLYVRDEETAKIWSLTPLPAGESSTFEVRHGAGYTLFRHHREGLSHELRVFSPPDAPAKIAEVRLRNLWQHPRRLTLTYYAEWVLGSERGSTRHHIVPSFDARDHTLLACNPIHPVYGGRVAFMTADRPPHGLTTDRTEFLGRVGSLSRPAGLLRIGLSGAVQPGVEACAAYQVHLDLGPLKTERLHFVLGQGSDREQALDLARRFRQPESVDRAWRGLRASWKKRLGAVRVRTPDRALNVLLNHWLPYQTLSCRLWARSALYQSSGAFGFRDQVQDVLALLHHDPSLAREHLLRAARRQFSEGDVLHWWHPSSYRGIRSRCSDDLLWLPYAVAEYVAFTGDEEILEEEVPYLAGEELASNEASRYAEFTAAEGKDTLYRHCLAALERGSTEGPHGLPLIGSGDWNDGMNRVGIEGRGESIWVGWFLCRVLSAFSCLCARRGDRAMDVALRRRARELRGRLDESGWDGGWYRRAYYDDGSVLGSARNEEARIDAISQAWAVLSGAAPKRQARMAMDAVARHLMLKDERLVLLLTPPFDRTEQDPGYIKGYPPGIRENGSQYSHAAAWVGMAFAAIGDAERAYEVLKNLNPILRAATGEDALRYRVEPYVQAADVYGAPPHMSRGGWSWYTGAAGWTYKFALESILGVRRQGDELQIDPVVPSDWEGYELDYRHEKATYRILAKRAADRREESPEIWLDGQRCAGNRIPLSVEAGEHEVMVRLASEAR
jgi:cyclic beta-1,2-glucan synthetase